MADQNTPLNPIIADHINAHGHISIYDFMALALGHPEHGYYMAGRNFGVEGDFITAPEISQIFGELIGLWSLDQLNQQGLIDAAGFFEMGPGRGVLMADITRTIAPYKNLDDTEIHMLEISPALKQKQQSALAPHQIYHHDDLNALPQIPVVFIANEFFDALPIRQFIFEEKGWMEQVITQDEQGLTLSRIHAENDVPLPQANIGDVFEIAPDLPEIVTLISDHINMHGGAALFIDYGKSNAIGDSLQAVRDHKPVDILDQPGLCDLSAWVDFDAIKTAAHSADAYCLGPVDQGDFLKALGLYERAEQLSQNADPKTRRMLAAAVDRLSSPAQMGKLFKVMAILPGKTLPEAAGFPVDGMNKP